LHRSSLINHYHDRDINPAWQKKVVEFNRLVVLPLFGEKETLVFRVAAHNNYFCAALGYLEMNPPHPWAVLALPGW
jgi:hypothetical protein